MVELGETPVYQSQDASLVIDHYIVWLDVPRKGLVNDGS